MTDQTATQATEPQNLRRHLADAIRGAACTGGCGKSEEECAKERIQPFVWHHGVLTVVEGTPEQFADVLLSVRDKELEQLRRAIRSIMVANRSHVDRLTDAHQATIGELRRAESRVRALEAEVAAAREFAAEMRDFCSPHGVAVDYADRLIEAMDRAKEDGR